MSDKAKRKTASQPPVSAHPAFPVIVALWFAALFGIGSMVLPIDMFERFAVASGLADAYSAAQPPFGATARILLALTASAIGALAGVFVARRVAAANAPRTVGRRAASLQPTTAPAVAKRPISAHEELFEGGLDGTTADEPEPAPRPAFGGRRRALAVTDDSARSDFLSFAPLPGRSANEADEPLDLVAFEAETTADAALDEAPPAPAHDLPRETVDSFGSAVLSAAPAFGSPHMTTRPFERAPAAADRETFARQDAPAADEIEQSPVADPGETVALSERPLGELGVVELVERFALALQRHSAAQAQSAPADALPAEEEPVHGVSDAAPEEPSQAHDDFVEATADFSAPRMTAMPAALMPFGFDEDEDEADHLPDLDLTAALSHNRAPFAAPPLEAVAEPTAAERDDQPAMRTFLAAETDDADAEADADTDAGDDLAEAGYTSLLAMKSPFGAREPVRIDDEDEYGDEGTEPVVVFPGQAVRRASPGFDGPARDALAQPSIRPFDAPLDRVEHAALTGGQPPAARMADSGATERALRDALEKLQKMSGAA